MKCVMDVAALGIAWQMLANFGFPWIGIFVLG